jgi:transcriptional regulator with XRE-family HTH domain
MMRKQIDWKKFSKMLHSTRLDADLGQRELARELEIPSATMSRAENGKGLDADTYVTLCLWLDKPCDHFLVRKLT